MRAVLVAAGAVLLGAVTGVAVGVLAVLVHRVDTVGLPWGMVLAVLASPASSLGLRAAGAGRRALLAYGGAWFVAVLGLLSGRPEGDYLVAGDAVGWGFLVLAAGAVMVVTVLGVVAAPRHGEVVGP